MAILSSRVESSLALRKRRSRPYHAITPLARELRFLGAAKLFQLGRLSSGKAARLAGLERVAFLYELDRLGLPALNLRDEEVEAEIQAARDLAG